MDESSKKRTLITTTSALNGSNADDNNKRLRIHSDKDRVEELKGVYASLIEAIGEDPTRKGLVKTPQRAAQAILHFTKGYEENLQSIILFEIII